MPRLKASWQVHAGLIPGQAIPEYTKTWHYTSTEYEQESGLLMPQRPRFQDMQREAQEYAEFLQDGGLNWVNLAYVWY